MHPHDSICLSMLTQTAGTLCNELALRLHEHQPLPSIRLAEHSKINTPAGRK